MPAEADFDRLIPQKYQRDPASEPRIYDHTMKAVYQAPANDQGDDEDCRSGDEGGLGQKDRKSAIPTFAWWHMHKRPRDRANEEIPKG